jgi:5-formyltetrahydrofolate cyclo-ligase
MLMDLSSRKQMLREKIWSRMEDSGIVIFPLPCRGRIPNFVGAQAAAEKLRKLKEWERAEAVFVNPDSPQRPVRENALNDRKILIMASPRLKRGLLLINPEDVEGKENLASTIKGAFRFGMEVQEFPKPGLVVQGSVAVDRQGHRLGKGHGYGDAEIRTLKAKFGRVPVATTVHVVQVVEEVPFGEDDEEVSIIVTPRHVTYVLS